MTIKTSSNVNILKPPKDVSFIILYFHLSIIADTDMTVRGKVNFNGVNRILPSPSCLFVTLADNSLMDAPATIIKTQRFDVSNFDATANNGKSSFEYKLTGKKPAKTQLWRQYSISATVLVGRCPEKTQAVRIGDILTNIQHSVKLTEAENEYMKDINTICYGNKKF